MEAKYAEITDDQIKLLYDQLPMVNHPATLALYSIPIGAVIGFAEIIRRVQAEITWKAREPEIAEARKAGIKEVVDFVHQMWLHDYGYPLLERADWQAKLREWGR